MKKSTPYFLLLPALIFTVFILVYPLFQNLINSLRDISLVEGIKGWTGLSNYVKVLKDDVFWLSFKNTALYAVFGTIFSLALGLAIALLLNTKIGRINNIFKFLYTVPWVVSPVVAGFAWKWMLNDNFGLVNYWLVSLGIIEEGRHLAGQFGYCAGLRDDRPCLAILSVCDGHVSGRTASYSPGTVRSCRCGWRQSNPQISAYYVAQFELGNCGAAFARRDLEFQ